MAYNKNFSIATSIPNFTGIIVVLLGIAVVLGWHFHIPQFIQIKSTYAPMQYNAALSFILLGLALISLNLKLQNSCIVFSSIIFVTSTFTLLEYLLKTNFGIDTILFQHPYITTNTPYPGRMAISTALSFLIISTCLLFLPNNKIFKQSNIVIGALGSIPFAMGLLALFGYITHFPSYKLGHTTEMAFNAAFGVTILSIGIFSLLVNKEHNLQTNITTWLPIPIITFIGTINIIIWIALSSSKNIDSTLPNIILITGGIISALMTYIIHLLDKAKQHTLKLEITNKKLDSILQHANNAIISINKESILTLWNPQAEIMFGYKEDDVIGKLMTELIIPPQYREKHTQGMNHMLKTGKASLLNKTIEIIAQRKNTEIFPVELSLFQSKFGEEPEYTAIIRDVTERKKTDDSLKAAYKEIKDTQEQLLHTTKLASMGELSAGIAHELTQPLQGIKGFAEAIKIDLDKLINKNSFTESETKKYATRNLKDLEIILQQTNRMSLILGSIRDFARSSNAEKILIDINKILESSLLLFIDHLKTQEVVLHKTLSNNLPKIYGNENQLQQVFINLISNSLDALSQIHRSKELIITSNFRLKSDFVEITIEDNGIGMDDTTLKKLFDPFFTTKIKGTGLGLSIVDRILKDHNAKTTVKSHLSIGTQFMISFPIQ